MNTSRATRYCNNRVHVCRWGFHAFIDVPIRYCIRTRGAEMTLLLWHKRSPRVPTLSETGEYRCVWRCEWPHIIYRRPCRTSLSVIVGPFPCRSTTVDTVVVNLPTIDVGWFLPPFEIFKLVAESSCARGNRRLSLRGPKSLWFVLYVMFQVCIRRNVLSFFNSQLRYVERII